MAFCSYSSSLANNTSVLLDYVFINEFMPQAPAEYVKVYIYGLGLCTAPNQDYNAPDSTCSFLGLNEQELFEAYEYWQNLGLVQIVNKNPLEVKYLPVRQYSGSAKLREKGKYTDFNNQVQQILGRMIRPIEFNEYYHLIESYHFEPDALVMIIKYCTMLKGDKIGYPYILSVAHSFERDNIKNAKAVEQKLLEQEQSKIEIKQVLDALGLKRQADIEERNDYLKWTTKYGFALGTIIDVAKQIKRSGGGGVAKLDELLTKYYEQKLFSAEEIANYNSSREKMYELAKNVARNLGLYYQNLDNVVETYILAWTNMGYDAESLQMISNYCFLHSYRSLESMNSVVNKFFKLGLVSAQSINQYITEILQLDKDIKDVLEACGLLRSVISSDREFYKTWTNSWGFDKQTILLVAQKSAGKIGAISYMNKVLSNLHSQNIHDLSAVEKSMQAPASSPKQQYISHTYSREELDALFDSLDDIEV